MKRYINPPVIIFLSILLFAIGLFSYQKFLNIILPTDPNFNFVVTHPNTILNQSILFALALGCVPLVFSVVCYFAKIDDRNRKMRLWFILFLFEILAFVFRCYMILSSLEQEQKIVSDTVLTVNLDRLLFGAYMLGALVVGGLVSIRIFRRMKMIIGGPVVQKVSKKNPQNHSKKDVLPEQNNDNPVPE